MANLLLESFDHYPAYTEVLNDNVELRRGNWSMPGDADNAAYTMIAGRYGNGQAIRMDSANDAIYRPLNYVGAAPSEVFLGFAYFSNKYAGNNNYEANISVHSSNAAESAPNCSLSIGMDGSIGVNLRKVDAQISRTTETYLSCNCWHYIEWRILVDNAVGSYDVLVDGVNVLSAAGVDTQFTSTADISMIEINSTLSQRGRRSYDDMYVNDNTGLAPFNGFLGEITIETLRPSANGFQNDFTAVPAVANFANVDDDPGPDDDTTYVESSTLGDIESYEVSSLSVSWDSILAVELVGKFRRMTGGVAKLYRQRLRSVASDFLGASTALSANYKVDRQLSLVDPDTAVAWTATGVNVMEVGYEIMS